MFLTLSSWGRKVRRQRQREVPVGDGVSERTAGRAFLIHMDPLIVASGLRKLVNALLSDHQWLTWAEGLADGLEQVIGLIDNTLGHGYRLQTIGRGTA
jgi:hypothetical protein